MLDVAKYEGFHYQQTLSKVWKRYITKHTYGEKAVRKWPIFSIVAC